VSWGDTSLWTATTEIILSLIQPINIMTCFYIAYNKN
jgi:hypothetical protein